MPRFNGTGPNGAGPFTGRGLGYCAGRGGFGGGFGRTRLSRYRRQTKEEEKAELVSYLKDLRAEMKEMEQHLKDLEDNK